MKMVFEWVGLFQVNYMGVEWGEIWFNFCVFLVLCEKIEVQVGYFCFVKLANLGFFVGIVKVWNCSELEVVLDNVVSYDCCIIVEVGLMDIREVECVVLGNENF